MLKVILSTESSSSARIYTGVEDVVFQTPLRLQQYESMDPDARGTRSNDGQGEEEAGLEVCPLSCFVSRR